MICNNGLYLQTETHISYNSQLAATNQILFSSKLVDNNHKQVTESLNEIANKRKRQVIQSLLSSQF